MKRLNLIKVLRKHNCILMREGAKYSVFFNPQNNKTSTIPRHNEIDDILVKKILKDLGIEFGARGRRGDFYRSQIATKSHSPAPLL